MLPIMNFKEEDGCLKAELQGVDGTAINYKKLTEKDIEDLFNVTIRYKKFPNYEPEIVGMVSDELYFETHKICGNIICIPKGVKFKGLKKYLGIGVKVYKTDVLNKNQMLIMCADNNSMICPAYRDNKGDVVLVNPSLSAIIEFEN